MRPFCQKRVLLLTWTLAWHLARTKRQIYACNILDQNPPKDLTVIDYSTGTGVLAIAAAKLGAKEIIAIDNDPRTVLATTNKIQTNYVDSKIIVLHSDEEGELNQVDLLIANILANSLVGLCEHFFQAN